MTNCLLLDTTQNLLMAGVFHQDNIHPVFSNGQALQNHHASVLVPALEKTLADLGLQLPDISKIAVNTGPGSFTGIRTGLTVARTLAQFGNFELFSFNTFELFAAHTLFLNQQVTVVLNAFRQQHYWAQLSIDEYGNVTWLDKPRVQANTDFMSQKEKGIVLIEDSLKPLLPTLPGKVQFLQDLDLFTPSQMIFLLQNQPQQYRIQHWSKLTPSYMQLPHITVKPAKT